MSRPYAVGDIVLASDVSLSIKGELVELIDEKNINPAGWCFQWAKSHGKPGLWMPATEIIRHATPEEVAEFTGERTDILQREIEIHQQAVRTLETQLNKLNDKTDNNEHVRP